MGDKYSVSNLNTLNMFLFGSFTVPSAEWSENTRGFASVHRIANNLLHITDLYNNNHLDGLQTQLTCLVFNIVEVSSFFIPKKYKDICYCSSRLIRKLTFNCIDNKFEPRKILKNIFCSTRVVYLASKITFLACAIQPSKKLKYISTAVHSLSLLTASFEYYKKSKKENKARFRIPTVTHLIASGFFARRAYTMTRS